MDVLSSLLGGESLLDIFSKTINGWFGGLVTEAFEKFDELMVGLLTGVFHFERMILSGATTVLTDASIRNVYLFLYLLVCSLVVLKFLFKGFQIYILWRDGDADSSPRDMLVGTIQSGVVMVCFPYLYEKAVNIFIYVTEGIMGRLGISLGIDMGFAGLLQDVILGVATQGALTILFLLVFAISVFVLWIRLIGRGFELMILRFGVPFASLGLLDSDMGSFKGYMQVFIKTAFTAVIQVSAMALALRVACTFQFVNILVALGIMLAAFSTPSIMQQFLMSSGQGGGMAQKAYSMGMVVRTIKGLV